MQKNGVALHSVICLILAGLTFAIYSNVSNFDFALLDDNSYIVENNDIRQGLNAESLTRTFQSTRGSLWIPLTWLSFMLDNALGSLDPGYLHVMNVLYHAIAAMLLFLALSKLSGAVYQSAFAACIFAVHPLHVESVAWITERKDVLSASFMFASLLMYAFHAQRPSIYKYLSSFILFATGLMAKPMIVAFPLLLMLLDYWPLQRYSTPQRIKKKQSRLDKTFFSGKSGRLILEKTPFILLSLTIAIVTFLIAQGDNALSSSESMPVIARIGNALVSYVWYVLKLFAPFGLAVFYPHSGTSLALWKPVLSAMLLIAATVFAIKTYRSQPYILTGWLWYLISLLPVIGLVQAGLQARADRFSYIPLTGLLIILAWGIPDLLRGRRYRKHILMALGLLSIIFCSALTVRQASYWKDSATLFERALIIPDNWLAHNNFGVHLKREGFTQEARKHFEKAIASRANYAEAHLNLGGIHLTENRLDDALAAYLKTAEVSPGYAEAYYNIATVYSQKGENEKAIEYFLKTLKLDREFIKAHNNLAGIYASEGQLDDAVVHLTEALILDPVFHDARYNLALIYQHRGQLDDAKKELMRILAYEPGNNKARTMLDQVNAQE